MFLRELRKPLKVSIILKASLWEKVKNLIHWIEKETTLCLDHLGECSPQQF
jgi:hypothetical protein